MSKKLAEKAGMIQLPPLPTNRTAPAPGDGRPKTAPGSMLHFMGSQSAAMKEAEELRLRVQAFDGALPVKQLDARRIRVSKWANRAEANFSGPEFAELKAEIAAAGGNVQPIKVRPLQVPTGELDHEIVFGHRRHRACLELGLPVQALIEPLSEQNLFVQMERENRQRKDLSAWEQGLMYARALDEGLYPSNRQLAAAINRDLGDVGKAISLARLPQAVVEAFPSPLDLQYRWAKPLNDLQQADPDGLLQRAKEAKKLKPKLTARQVLERLLDAPKKGVGPSNPSVPVEAMGRQVGTLHRDARGRVMVQFTVGAVAENDLAKLAEHLGRFFDR